MDQVVGRPAARQGPVQRGRVHDVALGQLHSGQPSPGPAGHFFQGAAQGAHPVAGRKQPGNQPAAHIAGGAGYQNGGLTWVHGAASRVIMASS